MKQKTILVLGVVAVALLATALVVANRDESAASRASSSDQPKKLFPELSKRVNDVTHMSVASKDSTIELAKSGESWGAADKGGYPVQFDRVKAIVVGLAEMEVLAEMSKNPANHEKFELKDISAEGSTAKRVTLKDANGAVLADVLIGKPKVQQGFGGKGALYVRKAGDDQVWEVTGQLNVQSDAPSWLDRDVSKVESARVKRVAIQHPDGATLSVAKNQPEDKNYTVENLPEGSQLMWEGVANGIASALQYMSLDDVQRNENFDSSGATTTEFDCFDGLVVTAKTIEKDGKTWMTLAASFDESQRSEPVGPPTPVIDETTGEAKPAESAEPPASTLKAVDDVKKEVDELNAKWGPWVYSVPGYNAANLRKKLTDLLKKDEPAVPSPLLPEGDATAPVDEHEGHDHVTEPPVDEPTPPDKPEKPADAPTGGGR